MEAKSSLSGVGSIKNPSWRLIQFLTAVSDFYVSLTKAYSQTFLNKGTRCGAGQGEQRQKDFDYGGPASSNSVQCVAPSPATAHTLQWSTRICCCRVSHQTGMVHNPMSLWQFASNVWSDSLKWALSIDFGIDEFNHVWDQSAVSPETVLNSSSSSGHSQVLSWCRHRGKERAERKPHSSTSIILIQTGCSNSNSELRRSHSQGFCETPYKEHGAWREVKNEICLIND